ncbi:Aldo/keto reductase [Hypoxylon trugodes]|uniref:Aldo/keto reductase n=1 Tax=Hypoxylon trugodes TaxID=326681 RepID=UPI002191F4E0|nr:Aldo/keto reductase [Hypoxylon trugodes]KAI1383537.1 Aldo/keto reductase [Hypoxylon trugodes]
MAPTGKSPLNLVLGVSSVGDTSKDPMARFDTPDEVNNFLDTFTARGYNQLDTARAYPPHAPGTSEPRLGAAGAGDRFIIDSKVWPEHHTKSGIIGDVDSSLEELRTKQINIEYLHMPDRVASFEEICAGMDQAYREGKIKGWGVSSYTAEEIQKFVDICEEHGYVKLSAYQGQYNAIVRGGEEELFPVLRKNGIAFYAYSPAAGGFFSGAHKNIKPGGRFDKVHGIGNLYSGYFLKPSIMEAVEKAVDVAAQHGINGHEAALRWISYHSILDRKYGDSIIVGASSSEQLNSNIDAIERGPLPEEVVAAFNGVYGQIDKESEVLYYR